MELKTRAEARAAGETRYFTGRPCKRGHLVERFVSSMGCVKCHAETDRAWNAAHREQKAESNRAWHAENREQKAEYDRARYVANYERETKRSRTWGAAHREQKAEYCRAWNAAHREQKAELGRAWSRANPEKKAAHRAARRAAKRGGARNPGTLEAIQAFYAEAKRLTKATGAPHAVDHIVPLQGKGVCGLHVPWNLRVITAVENMKKHNRLPSLEDLVAATR
jgi:hypothetical protein